MRTTLLAFSTLACLSTLAPRPAQAQSLPGAVVSSVPDQGTSDSGSANHAPAQPWSLQASYDLGVLSFGGIGVHAGVSKGPWAASAGYYRFESKEMFGGALGGFGEDFKLHVDYIASFELGYYFNGDTNQGWYATAIYQAKQQTVTHAPTGDEAELTSHLLGPEIGYEWRFLAGAFLKPRLGVLYYVKSPQPGRNPVNVGGASYDNPTHTWVDAYITADLGYEFDL